MPGTDYNYAVRRTGYSPVPLGAQALVDTRRLLESVLAEVSPPKTHPYFLDMKADHAGRLWLRLPSSTSSVVWRVLSPDGKHVGSVRLPSNVEPFDIGESYLVGVERDSLSVQTVLVYSFSSRSIPSEN